MIDDSLRHRQPSPGRDIARSARVFCIAALPRVHGADDLASLLADAAQHVADVEARDTVDQQNERQDAAEHPAEGDDGRQCGHHAVGLPVDSGQRDQGEEKRADEYTGRVADDPASSQHSHQTGRISAAAELHHHKHQREGDAGQSHHTRGHGREDGGLADDAYGD